MKICIVSDSHGRTDRIEQAARRHPGIDLLIHAGDHADDAAIVKDLQVKAVCGNCDRPGAAEAEELIDLYGIRILVTHGHHYQVKHSLLPLLYRAQEMKAQIAVFGHSHVPLIVEEQGILFINPGSLSHPRGGFQVPSYAVLDLEPSASGVRVRIRHRDASGKPMNGFAVNKFFLNQ
jgi:putative phosphoesterase